jgi:hypothetical protein
MSINRKNIEDEIEGEFIAPPEKTLNESLEEARGLSEKLREMQSHLGEDLVYSTTFNGTYHAWRAFL